MTFEKMTKQDVDALAFITKLAGMAGEPGMYVAYIDTLAKAIRDNAISDELLRYAILSAEMKSISNTADMQIDMEENGAEASPELLKLLATKGIEKELDELFDKLDGLLGVDKDKE